MSRTPNAVRSARPEDPAPDATGRFDAVLIAVAALAAVFLRLQGLGSEGLWVDEAYTVLVAGRPIPELLAQLRADEAPPLFYLLQKAFGVGTGSSETAARLFPALAGIGTVAAAAVAARRWTPRAAPVVAWTFAFSAVAVFYAQQARSYAFLHLLALLALAAAAAFRWRPAPLSAIALVPTSAALLFTHNLGLWPVLAALWVALGPGLPEPPDGPGWRRRLRTRPAVGLAVASAALLAAWVVPLVGQIAIHSEFNVWMGGWWEDRNILLGPLLSLATAGNGGAGTVRPPVPLPVLPEGWNGAELAVWLCMAAGLTLALHRSRRAAPAERLFLAAGALFAGVPLLGLVAVSLSFGPAYVVGRTDTLALPGILVLLGVGWSVLRPRALRAAVLGVWAVAGAMAVLPASPHREKESDALLAHFLGERVTRGDVVVVAPLGRPTLEYYAGRQGWLDRLLDLRSFPPAADENPAAVPPLALDDAGEHLESALAHRRRWEDAGANTIWVLGARGTGESSLPARPLGSSPRKGGASTTRTATRADAPWPLRPVPPPLERKTTGANAIAYPGNLVVYAFAGTGPVPVAAEYRQDWVGGERLVLRLDRETWAPVDSLPDVEVRR